MKMLVVAHNSFLDGGANRSLLKILKYEKLDLVYTNI